ncbi:hypothetical protein M885DRAFT_574461 [Pelagophyceae sp. CCMP2097]|nr:hypothetical protein M885DRAFT_574461 [Pelagophyceae sp. CCMP2097]
MTAIPPLDKAQTSIYDGVDAVLKALHPAQWAMHGRVDLAATPSLVGFTLEHSENMVGFELSPFLANRAVLVGAPQAKVSQELLVTAIKALESIDDGLMATWLGDAKGRRNKRGDYIAAVARQEEEK